MASASIFDVAREAGVSRATAARALGGYGSVSPGAKRRVLSAARKLGYSINSVARSMATGQTMTLGAIIADVSNPFFARVIRGFTDRARDLGYDVVLVNTDESLAAEIQGTNLLSEKRVDGIAVAPVSTASYEHLSVALQRGQAVVQLDRYIPGLDTDRVQVNNYEATFQAVRRVIAAGHTRIASPRHCLDDPGRQGVEVSTMVERHQGFMDAMRQAGLSIPEVFHPPAVNRQDVRKAVHRLLTGDDRPTALLGLDDTFTLGIIDAVHLVGLEIPREISVFGFDDTEWTTVLRPPLSVVAQPAYALGQEAARLLVARIQSPDAPRSTQTLSTTWIERASIAAPAS